MSKWVLLKTRNRNLKELRAKDKEGIEQNYFFAKYSFNFGDFMK